MSGRDPGAFESEEERQHIEGVVRENPKAAGEATLAYIERIAVLAKLLPAPIAWSSDDHLLSSIKAETPLAEEWGRPVDPPAATDDRPAWWDK